jgi:hypothetical protein
MEAPRAIASRYPPRTPVGECREEVIEVLAQRIEALSREQW